MLGQLRAIGCRGGKAHRGYVEVPAGLAVSGHDQTRQQPMAGSERTSAVWSRTTAAKDALMLPGRARLPGPPTWTGSGQLGPLSKGKRRQHRHIFIETPLGAFPSGMLLWLTNGVGVLAVLTLPISIGLASARVPDSLEWHWVPAQTAASILGCILLVRRSAAETCKL